jgi:hypothetical protein
MWLIASHIAARKKTAILALSAGKPKALTLSVPTAHMAPTNMADIFSALKTKSSTAASCRPRTKTSSVENK